MPFILYDSLTFILVCTLMEKELDKLKNCFSSLLYLPAQQGGSSTPFTDTKGKLSCRWHAVSGLQSHFVPLLLCLVTAHLGEEQERESSAIDGMQRDSFCGGRLLSAQCLHFSVISLAHPALLVMPRPHVPEPECSHSLPHAAPSLRPLVPPCLSNYAQQL